MKHLVLVGDGMADFPLADHGHRTPLELATTPALDRAARLGLLGLFSPIPDNLPPGSDIGNLSLLGYDPRKTFTGRAPLEAANQGLTLAPDQVAFRCNLVTLQDGLMADFTAGHIATTEARPLIEMLNAAHLAPALAASFHTGVSYRHLALLTCHDAVPDAFRNLLCTPPHDITGRPYAPHLPQGPGAQLIRGIIGMSQPLLAAHPVNAARVAAGKLPATSIWLWGQGQSPSIDPYPERFGLHGAVISAVDLVNGIGVCAGLEVVAVPGATGYLDTNYEGKVAAALDALRRNDFVYVHVEAPDETSHEGRTDLKIQAIEDFDGRVVAPCLEYVLASADTRLLIASDHATSIATRTHAGGPVPFAVCGSAVAPDDAVAYTERDAERTSLHIEAGHTLLPFVFAAPTLSAAALKEHARKCDTSLLGKVDQPG